MARPGVKEGKIRRRRDGIKRLRDAIGKRYFSGIEVEGHCIGIQARAWRLPPQPANYDPAVEAADAVIAAGKMRRTKRPRRGSLAWYATGPNREPGHVVTVVGALRKRGIGNVGETIEIVPLSHFNNFQYLGWCYPGDVPGWV